VKLVGACLLRGLCCVCALVALAMHHAMCWWRATWAGADIMPCPGGVPPGVKLCRSTDNESGKPRSCTCYTARQGLPSSPAVRPLPPGSSYFERVGNAMADMDMERRRDRSRSRHHVRFEVGKVQVASVGLREATNNLFKDAASVTTMAARIWQENGDEDITALKLNVQKTKEALHGLVTQCKLVSETAQAMWTQIE
jgi:hypothetical protein